MCIRDSNNDGCIISRTDEAKALGVGMAGPYFKAKPIIEANDVAVFSSNYNLYGDLSWRVMETLRIMFGADRVEVYSVDECFINLDMVPADEMQDVARQIRTTVEPVSYTHLDVYKRQAGGRRPRRARIGAFAPIRVHSRFQ